MFASTSISKSGRTSRRPGSSAGQVSSPKRKVTRWLNGHHETHSDSLKALKSFLVILLVISTLYVIIVTSVGYQHISEIKLPKNIDLNKLREKERTDLRLEEEFRYKQYFWISGVVSIAVIGFTMFGVIKESPTISMISAIFMLLAVAQSISSVTADTIDNTKSNFVKLHTPVAIIALLGALLPIYTALIWSSEFETPPAVIEEYKWYLNKLRDRADSIDVIGGYSMYQQTPASNRNRLDVPGTSHTF